MGLSRMPHLKYEPIHRMMNNDQEHVPEIHATSVNRGKSRATTRRLKANMPRNSMASNFAAILSDYLVLGTRQSE